MTDLKYTVKLNYENMQKAFNQIRNVEVRDSDVFLLGYPKSGTTWAQELIWLVLNDLNYEGAKTFVDERVPVLELSAYYAGIDSNVMRVVECHSNSVEVVKNMRNPRSIKTLIKWELLPVEILNGTKTPKIIYIARNPKDVCVSSFYYYTHLLNIIEDCTFEEYCHNFLKLNEKGTGKYWDHVLTLWNRRHQPNVLFIRYEEMKNNLSSVIQMVANFLGKTISKEEETNLIKWLDFETMKNNPSINHNTLFQKPGFIRTGKIVDHKNLMNDEIIKTFDSWIEENLKGTDYIL